jgi:hypothetical protein
VGNSLGSTLLIKHPATLFGVQDSQKQAAWHRIDRAVPPSSAEIRLIRDGQTFFRTTEEIELEHDDSRLDADDLAPNPVPLQRVQLKLKDFRCSRFAVEWTA